MCFASGPGKNMFESTSIIAHKLYEESMVSETIFFKNIVNKFIF